MILFEKRPVVGLFIKRINRFIVEVQINDKIHRVHVPNTGRMKELLVQGAKVLLKYHPASHKKTEYTLICVYKDDILVCIDSRAANDIYHEYLNEGKEKELLPIKTIKREVKYLNSRFDFGLVSKNRQVLIEVKSVNLVENTHALFPDAPTTRGVKHIKELIEAKRHGIDSAVIFIVQREDAVSFSPHWTMDQEFSNSLVHAKINGVIIKAYNCMVTPSVIKIKEDIPINFN